LARSVLTGQRSVCVLDVDEQGTTLDFHSVVDGVLGPIRGLGELGVSEALVSPQLLDDLSF